ncbi:hypothetical protein AAC387_Pa12g1638 [Persea americana]
MKSHARFLKLGLDTDPVIATRLLNAYTCTCLSPTSLANAHQLFDQVSSKDTVLWTSLISAYAQSANPNHALKLFSQMHAPSQTKPNHFTFTAVSRACGLTQHLPFGESIHACTIKCGFRSTVVVDTSILDMYGKCGAIDSSRKVFDEMPQRNLVSWNALIAGYVMNGMGHCALELFYRMKCVECEVPDGFSIVSALSACSGRYDLISGLQIHAYVVRSGLELDPKTLIAVASMYFRCREVGCAESLLKGSEENNMLRLIKIRGYACNGRYHDAIKSIDCNFVEVVSMDPSIIISVLTACANLSLLRIGRQVHALINTHVNCNNSLSEDEATVPIETALIDMYCKCHSVEEGQWVFDNLLTRHVSHWNSMITGFIHNGLLENACHYFTRMPERNVISWTAMISGHTRHGLPKEGLSLLAKMYNEKQPIEGNYFTFATALDACSRLTALDAGKQIHAKSIRTLLNADLRCIVLETALLDMYSKSGNLTYSQRVFNQMGERSVVTWTSMIMGYAIHGHGSQALNIFQQMLDDGLEPNEVTFIAVLSACSHCGLVEEGIHYFKLIKEKYGILPREDHYTCMVDLLGRAGKLSEAWSLMEEVKSRKVGSDHGKNGNHCTGGSVLGALLGGCHLHGDVEMGSRVAKMMLDRKEQVCETYVALSNVYASAGMWDEAYRVRQEWLRCGVLKEPGSSQIQIGCFS